MSREIILHDDSIIEEPKKPEVKIPSPVEEETVIEKTEVKVKPVDNKTRDIIILVILIVLIIGAFMILNYINKKKLAAMPASV